MEKVKMKEKKDRALKASLVRKAWINIILLTLAVVIIGLGFHFSSQLEWAKRADISSYNQGVSAYNLPPQILPATEERPSESSITRAAAYFQQAASETADNRLESLALYNLGTMMGEEALISIVGLAPSSEDWGIMLEDGISILAEAIRIDPDNLGAKYNLELLEKVRAAMMAQEGAGSYGAGEVLKGF